VTELALSAAAARRRRARADRSATLGTYEADTLEAGTPEARAHEAGRPEARRSVLVVLLPSADAATIVLLCQEAAELVG
jgi:hypothetical protein